MIASFLTPYVSPPLRSNKRLHHMAEYRLKADIRLTGKIQAQSWMNEKCREGWMFPLGRAVHVRMVWSVPTKHRRDADSGQPTLKSFLDGIVDAGVIADDNWRHVPRVWCEIEHTPGRPMSLRVELLEAT